MVNVVCFLETELLSVFGTAVLNGQLRSVSCGAFVLTGTTRDGLMCSLVVCLLCIHCNSACHEVGCGLLCCLAACRDF